MGHPGGGIQHGQTEQPNLTERDRQGVRLEEARKSRVLTAAVSPLLDGLFGLFVVKHTGRCS